MRFGFHISIAGGFSKVVERARKRGCETIQLFSRNPRGWAYKPLDPQEVNRFREDFSRSAIFPLLRDLRQVEVQAPVRCGQVILANGAGTGVDVLASRDLPAMGMESSERPPKVRSSLLKTADH